MPENDLELSQSLINKENTMKPIIFILLTALFLGGCAVKQQDPYEGFQRSPCAAFLGEPHARKS